VNDTGNETQDCEKNVDQEISATTALKKDPERWQDNGKNDLEDTAVGKLVML